MGDSKLHTIGNLHYIIPPIVRISNSMTKCIFGFNDFNFVLFSTNTTNSDKDKDTARQWGQIFSVLIFLFKTTTENLPTQPCCVPGVRTDSLSKFVAFIENGTKLKLTTPSMTKCAL